MNWQVALELGVKFADALARYMEAVNKARAEGGTVDLSAFREYDDAKAKALQAEIDAQLSEGAAGKSGEDQKP